MPEEKLNINNDEEKNADDAETSALQTELADETVTDARDEGSNAEAESGNSDDESLTVDDAEADTDTDDTGSEYTEKERPAPAAKAKSRPLFRVPILIAACIFLCTILFFAGWKCFFDTSIEGDWAVEVTSSDGEKVFGYTFSFDDDHVFRMRSGGTTLVGRYYFDTRKNSDGTTDPIFSIYLTNMGSPYISADFGYSFSGNVFTGRTLTLTDYSGLFLPADNADSDPETVKSKKAVTGFVERDGTTYYTWDFLSSDYRSEIEYFDGFKPDETVLGSWIYTEENTGYSYTLTFNEDGSFEQYSYESEMVGAYDYSDGKFTLRFYGLGGTLSETDVAAAVSGDELTFNGLSYKRTADKNDYKTGIK